MPINDTWGCFGCGHLRRRRNRWRHGCRRCARWIGNAVGQSLAGAGTSDSPNLAQQSFRSSEIVAENSAALQGTGPYSAYDYQNGSDIADSNAIDAAAAAQDAREQNRFADGARLNAGSVHAVGSGDSLSRILGTSDPQALGNVMRANGMRNSSLAVGQDVFVPADSSLYGNQTALGQGTLNSDNARLQAIADARAQASGGNFITQAQVDAVYPGMAPGVDSVRSTYVPMVGSGDSITPMSAVDGFLTFNPVGKVLAGTYQGAKDLVSAPWTLFKGAANLIDDAVGYTFVDGWTPMSALGQSIESRGPLATTGDVIHSSVLSLPGVAQIDALAKGDAGAFGRSLPGTFAALAGMESTGAFGNTGGTSVLTAGGDESLAVGQGFNSAGQMQRNGSRLVLNQGNTPTCAVYSCGMVLDTLGNPVDMTALLNQANVGANGMTMNRVATLLQNQGVSATFTTRVDMSDLAAATADGNPAIAAVTQGGGGHAIVVDGITTRMGTPVVAIRDPWGQQYFETVDSFSQRFLRQAIVIKGTP